MLRGLRDAFVPRDLGGGTFLVPHWEWRLSCRPFLLSGPGIIFTPAPENGDWKSPDRSSGPCKKKDRSGGFLTAGLRGDNLAQKNGRLEIAVPRFSYTALLT